MSSDSKNIELENDTENNKKQELMGQDKVFNTS